MNTNSKGNEMSHRCTIELTTEDPFYPGNPGYRVVCEECGPFKYAERYPQDAHAVCDRHEAVNGFERTR